MRFVNYKIITGVILLIILIIFLFNTSINLLQIQGNETVMEKLENELESKKNRNIFLEEQLKYVLTDEFIEKESRQRLGLVKSGEVVVMETFESEIQQQIDQNISKPNWKLWLEMFM